MIKVIYCFLFLSFTSSCISVSTLQRKAVRQFAARTEVFSAFPEKIMTELADIRESRGIYYANSFTDTESHLTELNAIFKERMNDDKIQGRVKLAFGILDEYANGLVQLSTDDPFKTMSDLYEKTGNELESLVVQYNQIKGINQLPTGLGPFITSSMDFGTKAYLAKKQRKQLKKYVSQADTLVSAVCDEMVSFLSSEGLGRIISNEESGVTESLRFYFIKRIPPSIESDKEYFSLMKRVEMVKQLQIQTIRASKSLKLAHGKLAQLMNEKKELKEIVVELTSFYKDVDRLRSLVLKISKH